MWSVQLSTSVAKTIPLRRHASVGYIAPFLVFVAILAAEHVFAVPLLVGYSVRFALTLFTWLLFSLPETTLRPSRPLASIGIGLAVFVVWIGPDLLFGYRHFWLFENSITGTASGSLTPGLQHNPLFLILRIAGSALLVPVIEELFWRAWMMRWLIDRDFERVPLGAYLPSAFWTTAILFASEHGPYWEVGLAAGIVYNWWIIRTKSLADCILAHAVTNGALAAYVIAAGAWQYWL